MTDRFWQDLIGDDHNDGEDDIDDEEENTTSGPGWPDARP